MTDEIAEIPDEVVTPPLSPGKTLAAAREEKGLNIADVARSLRLSPRQVEALETDDYARLPGKTFQRGFIRNYAKLLQIDPEPLLEAFQGIAAQQPAQAISVPPGQVELAAPRSQRTFSGNHDKPWLKYVPIAVLVVGIIGWMVYELMQAGHSNTVVLKPVGDGTAVPLPLPPSASPSQMEHEVAAESAVVQTGKESAAPTQPAAKAEPSSVDQGAAKLKLSFVGESWVELKDKSGRIIYKQTGQAGSEQIISGTPPFSLTIGKAVNVKLDYNGRSIDLAPYTNGDVAHLNLE